MWGRMWGRKWGSSSRGAELQEADRAAPRCTPSLCRLPYLRLGPLTGADSRLMPEFHSATCFGRLPSAVCRSPKLTTQLSV